MSTEQQIASIVLGWVLIAMCGAAAYYVHWTDKRHAERESKAKAQRDD